MTKSSQHKSTRYSQAQATQWLSWMAKNMQRHDKTIFLIEGLQGSWLHNKLESLKGQFSRLISHLESVDPKNILKKGYCIPFSENLGSVIISSQSLSNNEKIKLLFHDGKVKATVDSIDG